MYEKDFSELYRIIDSEQQILQRLDQKALHMLTLLGVLMVLLLSYLADVPHNAGMLALFISFLLSAMVAITSLLLVVYPRIKTEQRPDGAEAPKPSPLFYGGIVQYPTLQDYVKRLHELGKDDDEAFQAFASQAYALAKINQIKYMNLRRGIMGFIGALLLELAIIAVSYWLG